MADTQPTGPTQYKPPLLLAKDEFEKYWIQVLASIIQRQTPEAYHYCRAEAFYSIVRNRTFWLSEILTMNDASEMFYPKETIEAVFSSFNPRPPWFPDILFDKSEFRNLVASWKIYVMCFCSEGDLLSQWRAYGSSGGGFAIGVDAKELWNHVKESGFGFGPMPVIYDRGEQQKATLNLMKAAEEIAKKYRLSESDCCKLGDDLSLKFSALLPIMKHPAFKEERESRLILIANTKIPEFRAARGIVIPYIALPAIPPKVFKTVTLGPAVEPEFGKGPTRLFLDRYEMSHVEIRTSDIPLRVLAS
ncbi:MAG: DUF2971 domain-containing protein [Terriglobia bacterium]